MKQGEEKAISRAGGGDSPEEWIRVFIHELRNHLAVVSVNVEMVETDLREGALRGATEHNLGRIGRIKKSIHFIKEALQDMRTLYHPRSLEIGPVDINAFLRETGNFIEPECHARGISLHYDLADGIPPVETDRKYLSSALLNIIINAEQAIGRDGTITLSSRDLGGRVAVSVEDTGGGIPREMEEKIFRDFFSTKDDGTGLGLTIVGNIVSRLGGELCWENRPGEGMAFTIRLPVQFVRRDTEQGVQG